MTTAVPRKLSLNLAVRDLRKSRVFFAALGFTFNLQFTDDNADCRVFSDDGYAMLLQEPYFGRFTRRPIVDARQQTEGIFALSCASRAEVDDILQKALAAGAAPAVPNQDHGFMYGNASTTWTGTIGRCCGWIRNSWRSEGRGRVVPPAVSSCALRASLNSWPADARLVIVL